MPGSRTVLPRRARGVYVCAAPRGMVRLQAIDSEGELFLELTMAERAFTPDLVDRVQAHLDRADPVGPHLRLVTA